MIICICHRVSDRDIARAVREGCADFDTLQDQLRVATGCGACRECARETFDAARAQACAGACQGQRTAPTAPAWHGVHRGPVRGAATLPALSPTAAVAVA